MLQGFKSIEAVAMQAMNFSDPAMAYKTIGEYVTLMHFPMGIILPIFMLGFMTRFFGKNKSWMEGFRAWKYCLMASACFLVPYLILAWLVGPELPSMVGGLLGLGALVWLTQKGFCVPTDGVWDFDHKDAWDAEWTGSIEASSATEYKEHMSQTMAWLPYVLCGLLLVLTRVPAFHLKPIVTDPMFSVGWANILGYEGVTSKIALLNLPGTIPFILVSIITIGLHKMNGEKIRQAWGTALEKMTAPTIALVPPWPWCPSCAAPASTPPAPTVPPCRPCPWPWLCSPLTWPAPPGPCWPLSWVAWAPSSPAPAPCPTCSSPTSSGIWAVCWTIPLSASTSSWLPRAWAVPPAT